MRAWWLAYLALGWVLRILIGDNCKVCISTPAGVFDARRESLEVGKVSVRAALRVIFFLSADRPGQGGRQQFDDCPSMIS
jgi:hypothetical protein